MDDAARDALEAELDRKELSLFKVRNGKAEYEYKIKYLERSIRRVEREMKVQDDAIQKLEEEITKLKEELANG